MQKLVGIFLMLASVGESGAVAICANNSDELSEALLLVGLGHYVDEIRIETGFYDVPPEGFQLDTGIDPPIARSISISGGWGSTVDAPCAVQSTLDPFATVLDGGGKRRVLDVELNWVLDISISNLTFASGRSSDGGAGLRISGGFGFDGDVNVENNVFLNNESDTVGAGLKVQSARNLDVLNNYFVANRAGCHSGAAIVSHSSDGKANLVSNTVVNNEGGVVCKGLVASNVQGVTVVGSGRTAVFNNILWGNGLVDLGVHTPGAQIIANNVGGYEAPSLDPNRNFSVDPKFQNQGIFNARLQVNSPLIDRGIMPGPIATWRLAPADLDGELRILGDTIDIGAYEQLSDLIFDDGFQ